MIGIARCWKNVVAMLLWLVGLSALLGGCGIDPNLTVEEQERDAAMKLAWVDKAAELARRHNLAYRVEIDSTGRPSIGESIYLYLDTGLSARVVMFGNAAADRSEPAAGGAE